MRKLRCQSRYCGTNSCPGCAAMIVAPIRSEYQKAGVIFHYWICDDCACVSKTQICLTAASADSDNSSFKQHHSVMSLC
jgi:hypothetical protein